jgi:hypothetical protein
LVLGAKNNETLPTTTEDAVNGRKQTASGRTAVGGGKLRERIAA